MVASEMTVKAFLMHQIAALSGRYDVTLIVNTKQSDFAEQNGLPIKVIPLAIERAIHPVADIRALYNLFRLFRRNRFDLVHSVTPKAGLLAMMAGKMAGVRFRVHTFTGQVWAIGHGLSRMLLKAMDRLLAASATNLLADSFSQRQFLIDQEITRPDKLSVLADGSISGVDSGKFRPDNEARSSIRKQMEIAEDDILFLFLGRLKRDKGILDMASAYVDIAAELSNIHMLLVGPDEDCLKEKMNQIAGIYARRLHFVDYTDVPERYMAAADVFCLPSYREGFGNVIIEAAACGLSAIGSRIYGITDAIIDGKTGLLFPAGDVPALAFAIKRMAIDHVLRKEMGEQAQRRAIRDFPSERVTQAWLEYYDALL